MTDIVERLLNRAANAVIVKEKPNLYYDAAHEIERLRAENEKLREALKPFAYYASQIPEDASNTASASGTVGELRAAAAALKESGE